MNKTNTLELARKLGGLVTIKIIQNRLNVNRARAIYLVHRLRKLGYVKTKYDSKKMRIYDIDKMNKLGGISYIDIINKYVPPGVKLATTEIALIHGRVPSIEETLVHAVSQRTVRYTIACLALFRKIRNWSELYKLAKKQNLLREIAALHEIARLVIPKVKRMPERFKNLATPKKNEIYKYIIDKFN